MTHLLFFLPKSAGLVTLACCLTLEFGESTDNERVMPSVSYSTPDSLEGRSPHLRNTTLTKFNLFSTQIKRIRKAAFTASTF